jgi:hypothetical protein
MNALRLAPLLLLAGCSWFGGGRTDGYVETRPEYLACQREARTSPEVQALAARSNVENPLNQDRMQPLLREAEIRAYRDCLRRIGVALPGGVEAVRRR